MKKNIHHGSGNDAKSPLKAVIRVNQELNIRKSSVYGFLKNSEFYPYNVNIVQATHSDETNIEMESCEWISSYMDASTLFNDEALFHSNGQANQHSTCAIGQIRIKLCNEKEKHHNK